MIIAVVLSIIVVLAVLVIAALSSGKKRAQAIKTEMNNVQAKIDTLKTDIDITKKKLFQSIKKSTHLQNLT